MKYGRRKVKAIVAGDEHQCWMAVQLGNRMIFYLKRHQDLFAVETTKIQAEHKFVNDFARVQVLFSCVIE